MEGGIIMSYEEMTYAEQLSDIYYDNLPEFLKKVNQELKETNPRFTASTDLHTGALCLNDKETNNGIIYATPFYEGLQHICIDISFWGESDSEDMYQINLKIDDQEISFMESKGANKLLYLLSLYKRYLPIIIAIYEAKRKSSLVADPLIIPS